MAGRLWLWCDGEEAGASALSAQLGLPRCESGGKQPGREDAVLVWGASPLPGVWAHGEQVLAAGEVKGEASRLALPADEALVGASRSPLPWLLNRNASEVARMGSEELRSFLETAGLHIAGEGDGGRLYRVVLGGLDPLLAERVRTVSWRKGMLHADPGTSAGSGSWRAASASMGSVSEMEASQYNAGVIGSGGMGSVPLPNEDPAQRRAIRAAQRALYELGLETAEVLVRSDDTGRAAISALRMPGCARFLVVGEGGMPAEARLLPSPAPAVLWQPMFRRIEELLRGDVRTIQIGADPEFILVRPDGRIYSASRLGGLHSPVGSDVLLSGRQLRQPVGELRPEPSPTAEGLAESIRRLLAIASRRGAAEPGMRLLAGAMPLPGLALGGHVHLSGVPLTPRLLRVLDSYAAFPMVLVEDPRGRSRRPRYGTLGDSRAQPHGGFEYRTLPSWLVSPATTRYALAVCRLAAEDYSYLSYLPSLEPRYVQAYYEGDKETLALCLPLLRQSLERAPSYERHRKWLEPFLEAASQGICWDESRDLRTRWGIPVPRAEPAGGSEQNRDHT